MRKACVSSISLILSALLAVNSYALGNNGLSDIGGVTGSSSTVAQAGETRVHQNSEQGRVSIDIVTGSDWNSQINLATGKDNAGDLVGVNLVDRLSTSLFNPKNFTSDAGAYDAVRHQAALNDYYTNHPQQYLEEAAALAGVDVSIIAQEAAKGNFPTARVEVTADAALWGREYENLSTYDLCNLLIDPEKNPGGNIDFRNMTGSTVDNLNRCLLNGTLDITKLTSEFNAASRFWGFTFRNGQFVQEGMEGQITLSEQEGARLGAAYASLIEALLAAGYDLSDAFPEGTALPDISIIDLPPLTGTPATLQWTSQPQAFAEVKHNKYSTNRTEEKWEAMAGVPHDETLFYDAGASILSADLVAEYDTSSPSAPHYELPFIGAGHVGPFCTDSGGAHPSHSGPPAQKCMNPGDCTINGHNSHSVPSCTVQVWNSSAHRYEDCGGSLTPNCTESNHVGAEVEWALPEIAYYPMSGFEVTEPTDAREPAPYVVGGEITASYPGGGSVSFTEAWGFQGWNVTECPPVSWACNDCDNAPMAMWNSWYCRWAVGGTGGPATTFKAQRMTITTAGGNTYKVQQDVDLDIWLRVISADGGCAPGGGTKGTLKIGFCATPAGETSPVVDLPEGVVNYWGGSLESITHVSTTNFMPYEESWSPNSHFVLKGYNGRYNENGRRAGGAMFYKEGIQFVSNIPNGEKITGPGHVMYTLVSNGSYGSASAITDPITKYSPSHSKCNNVVVHSPVALRKLIVIPVETPYDERTGAAQNAHTVDVYLTPSLDFFVQMNILWTGPVQEWNQGIAETTEKKGIGYYPDLDTKRWIDKKYLKFPFEVIYEGVRYNKDTWIEIPIDIENPRFTLPLSEREVKDAEIIGLVVAKNSPYRGNPDAAYAEHSELKQNYTRNCHCQGAALEAPHGAHNTKNVDILGRIGNFNIDFCADPNWNAFFSTPKSPLQWDIPGVTPKVDQTSAHFYLGPALSIFDRRYWNDSPFQEITNFGLDHYSSVPSLGRGHLGAILPAGPGKNWNGVSGVEDLLAYEPIKMGYPVWWSIETIGNYGDSVVRLQVHPTFKLFDPSSGTAEDVDVYEKVGSSYKKIYDSYSHLDGDYKRVFDTKLTHAERRLGSREKGLTKDVVGEAYYTSELFNPALVKYIGTPNHITLEKTLRTFFGTTLFEGVDHAPNPTANSAEVKHAQQAQRWHGTIFLPSSSKFTRPGIEPTTEHFIPTEGKYILVELTFTTDGSTPWEITTSDKVVTASSPYRSWIEEKPPSTPGDPDPTPEPKYPPDPHTVIVYDPNETSLQDIQIHGTH